MTTESAATAVSPKDSPETVQQLLDIVGELFVELRAGRAPAKAVTLDSALERELGFDSLSRAELLLRIERRFRVRLSEQSLNAESPRDLLRAVLAVRGDNRASAAELQFETSAAAQAAPEQAKTLLEVLDWHVQADAQRIYLYLYEDSEQPLPLSYGELVKGARSVAAGLRERGLQAGQTVAIMLPTGLDYFFSFFGILLAGGTPVPIYPPVRPSQIEEHLRRHARILGNARSVALITVPEAKVVARLLKTRVVELRHVVTVAELSRTTVKDWIAPTVRPADIAFLQYTSGSTGDPKGVMLSHNNLLANLRAMGQRVQVDSGDVFVSWLPLYHDMGLIGAALSTLYFAFPLVVMSPLKFLKRPATWLWAIHHHRGTVSAAPNFAYELCLRNIDDAEIEGLDLSSWRWAMNGAEPVSVVTLRRFAERFEPFGLDPRALAPVYGLAECAVGLALPEPGRGLKVDRIQREGFMRSGHALPAGAEDVDAMEITACGHVIPGHEIRVVDDGGREVPDRQEGRLEFKGPSATAGYLHNPAATADLVNGEWLNTGDRAYLAGGDVFITGRIKDVIIRGGRNLYPYELEQAVAEIPGIRKGCVAVFASHDGGAGTEKLVVVAETRETEAQSRVRLQEAVREASVDLLGSPADDIVLARPHTVLKTSSGKIRRVAIRELYETGGLGRGGRALWWQLVRLTGASIVAQLHKLLHRGGEFLYAAYAWTVLVALAPLVWGLVCCAPRAWVWPVCRGTSRLLARLTATPLTVQGLERLPGTPCVLVANHSSYLDALIMVAAMPRDFAYVAKQELATNVVLRLPLRRLGTIFVERFDLVRSAADAARVATAVRAGQSLAFFPEGTFYRMPGLQPFRMGAFMAAAQAGVPVVPVTIRGARAILRAESWFPRRGALQLIVGESIAPAGDDWQAAVQLRDATRMVILRHGEEPDLGSEEITA